MRYKRFMVFAHDECYALGALFDCHSSYDTLEEAEAKMKDLCSDGFQHLNVFDRINGIYIKSKFAR